MEAIIALDQAIQIDPQMRSHGTTKVLRLHIYNGMKSTRAFEQPPPDPDYAHVWNIRGIALTNLGLHEEAVVSCDHAIRVDPRYAAAWKNKGIALRNLGRYDAALTAVTRALDIDPSFKEAQMLKDDLNTKINFNFR